MLGSLLLISLLLGTNQLSSAEDNEKKEGKYLFICAGDQARKAPDFLAVVNLDDDSPQYGKVIATAPLSGPGATGNEFHHIGLSADGKVAACGGLLSVLKGQKRFSSGMSQIPVRPSSSAQLIPRCPRSQTNFTLCPKAASW
jgi:hypothetical protein